MPTQCITRTILLADLGTFITAMNALPHHHRLALALMYYAGLRVGETAKLAWSDLVYEHLPLNAIALTAAMCKNNVGRIIPINGALANVIVDVWEGHARANDIPPSGYATAKSRNTNATSSRTLQRVVRNIGLRMQYPKLTPHVLRHTFATRLLAVADIVTVQQALGHSRLTDTQRYLHPTADQMRIAVEIM